MISIIIVHTGNTFYLKAVLNQARIFNKKNPIYLISDNSTKNIPSDICTHVNIEEYMHTANKFSTVYKHRSSNDFNFELFCFQRWLIIYDFVRRNNIKRFVCLDSDFLLFDNVDSFLRPYVMYDYTLCGEMGPNCMMFSQKSIARLCKFLFEMYMNPDLEHEFVEEYEKYKLTGKLGGICDMTALTWYAKKNPGKVANMLVPLNGVAVDDYYYSPSGYVSDESQSQLIMNRVPKKIKWINNLPYGIWKETGELVRFAGLHLQGGAKRIIYKFLVDEQKVKQNGLCFKLKWVLSPMLMKYRWERINNKIILLLNK